MDKNPEFRKFHLNIEVEDLTALEERYGATIGKAQAIRIAIKRLLASKGSNRLVERKEEYPL